MRKYFLSILILALALFSAHAQSKIHGKIFDTNENKKELYHFWVGHDEVIFGWDEAVQHMNVGGKATVIVPSRYAYGERGSGPIAPYTPLA